MEEGRQKQKRASHAQGMNVRGTFPHTAGERPHARRDVCRSAQLSPSPERAAIAVALRPQSISVLRERTTGP